VCKPPIKVKSKEKLYPSLRVFQQYVACHCTQGNQNDSWLLVVRRQIGNLTPDLSFGHNLCFKYPNVSCKRILNIYVPRYFQWYKEFFNPMGFDPYNCSLKIRESIRTPTLKVGAHLGVWRFIPSCSPTFPRTWNGTPELHSWPHTFASPCLGHEPKARVGTLSFSCFHLLESQLSPSSSLGVHQNLIWFTTFIRSLKRFMKFKS